MLGLDGIIGLQLSLQVNRVFSLRLMTSNSAFHVLLSVLGVVDTIVGRHSSSVRRSERNTKTREEKERKELRNEDVCQEVKKSSDSCGIGVVSYISLSSSR